MSSIESVIVYICKKYPIPDELSKARLTKLVYLCDWESARKVGRQITDIKWYFHNFGPYVDDVIQVAKASSYISVTRTQNMYGESKELISLCKRGGTPRLPDDEREIIKKVIDETRKFYWNDFIKHVYATYPIASSSRYTELDLVKLARKLSDSSHKS